MIAAEAAPDPDARLNGREVAAAPANWTFGEKTVLWIRVEFPDDPGTPATDAQITASMADVDQFYRDVSHDRCSLRLILFPGVLRVSRTKSSVANGEVQYWQVENDVLQLARNYDAANGNSGTFNPDRADRYIILAKSIPSLGFLGIAGVGSVGAYLNGTVAPDVIAHELGHNHGLFHSHSWRPTSTSAIGAGTHSAYGDVFDDMGNTALVPAGHFNTKQKEILLYLDSAQIKTVTTAGTYRVFRHDHRGATGVQALKVVAGDYDYWLEYRQQAPRSTFNQTTRMRNGVQVRWGRYPSSYSGNGTYLLDSTPTSGSGMDDAPTMVGETFVDPTNGLSFTPMAVGGDATREWIDVRVDYGSTNGTNRNPSLAANAPVPVVPARTDITFTATATDPDGDSTIVRWEFGDGKPLQVGTNVTHRFAKGGNYSLQCSAIDGRGGLATKSFNVAVDDPLLAWTRRDTPTGVFFNSVIHDGRQFIAAGSSTLLTSPDGVSWTRRTAIPSNSVVEIAIAGSSYVAVGYRPTPPTVGAIAFSNDGLTWRDVTPGTTLPELRSVAFGAGRFVAVGKSGALLHSLDGAAWITVPPPTTKDFWSVRFAAGRFVTVGDAGTVLMSADGLTWENRAVSTAATLAVVAYYRDKWITGNGSNFWTSPDTQTWTQQTTVSRLSFQRLVSVGTDVLLAPALNDTLFFSEDGETWDSTTLTTPATTATLRAAGVGNGTIVLVSTDGRIFQTKIRSSIATAPEIAFVPQSQFVPIGQTVSFFTGPAIFGTTYQWFKNGDPIEGATGATLTITDALPTHNGVYTATLSNYAGNATTPPATLIVDPNTARLVNLSIRARAGPASGADILTLGFVVGRSFYTSAAPGTSKQLLTRGIGPTLQTFGVSDALADPRIEFFDGATRIGSNDDWGVGTLTAAALTSTFRNVGAFELNIGSKDAALLSNFAPKAYTVQLTSTTAASGQALAEVYDLDTAVTSARLVNVSVRAPVGSAPNFLIGGFVIGGAGTRTVLIRAVGPGLAQFGVTGVLAAPVVTVFSGDRVLMSNAGWGTAENPVSLQAAAQRVGAFALPGGSLDSAVLAMLPAGAYTIQVSGANNTTGIALVEFYEVP
jgi:hypothetical protein